MSDERHLEHLQDGFCPAISHTRAWCCLPAGHVGRHGTPRAPHPDRPVGPDNPVWVDWER